MQRAIVFFCLMTLLPFSAAYAVTFVFMNNSPAASGPESFVSSTPRANQTLGIAPESVIVSFSSPIFPDKSSIKVYDMYGTQLNDGSVTVNGTVMTAALPPLPTGKYAVKWKTRCLCDENTELSNEFHFTVQ